MTALGGCHIQAHRRGAHGTFSEMDMGNLTLSWPSLPKRHVRGCGSQAWSLHRLTLSERAAGGQGAGAQSRSPQARESIAGAQQLWPLGSGGRRQDPGRGPLASPPKSANSLLRVTRAF